MRIIGSDGLTLTSRPNSAADACQCRILIPCSHSGVPGSRISACPNNCAEELISRLSRIAGLAVIARTSAMSYKGTDKRVDEIGRELGVGTILEGSVRKAGDALRITVQLIDVTSQQHLWSQDYDRAFEDIFVIQTDIAQRVAGALQVTLLSGEQQELGAHGTDSLEAYNLYLKGLYQFNKYSEGIQQSCSFFRAGNRTGSKLRAALGRLGFFLGRTRLFRVSACERGVSGSRVGSVKGAGTR